MMVRAEHSLRNAADDTSGANGHGHRAKGNRDRDTMTGKLTASYSTDGLILEGIPNSDRVDD